MSELGALCVVVSVIEVLFTNESIIVNGEASTTEVNVVVIDSKTYSFYAELKVDF